MMIEIERDEESRNSKWYWRVRKIELDDFVEGPFDLDWETGAGTHYPTWVWRDEWAKTLAERDEWYRTYPDADRKADPNEPFTVSAWIRFGGSSREPLLDACRELKRIGVVPSARIALFRPGRSDWDLRTTVGYGASRTVSEPPGRSPSFVKFTPHPRSSQP